jgi:hypothetical protein
MEIAATEIRRAAHFYECAAQIVERISNSFYFRLLLLGCAVFGFDLVAEHHA